MSCAYQQRSGAKERNVESSPANKQAEAEAEAEAEWKSCNSLQSVISNAIMGRPDWAC
jgi:hypothetical protein